MFASRFAFLPSVARSPHRSSLLRPLAKKCSFSEPLCFHTLTHSSKTCILPTPAPSIACALFAKNTGVGGYHGYSRGARTRHTCHQHFACKPFSFSRLRTLSVTTGGVPCRVHFARHSAASHSGSLTTVSLSLFISQISQTPSDNSFACTNFQKTARGWGYESLWELWFSSGYGCSRAAKFLGISAPSAANVANFEVATQTGAPHWCNQREIQKR